MNPDVTRALVVMFGVVGCGGDDVTSTPDAGVDAALDASLPVASVTVTSASCTATSSSIVTDATFDVVLAPGQGFDVAVGFGFDVGTQTSVSIDYRCGGWEPSLLGSTLEVGCARGSGPLQQVVTIREVQTLGAGTFPTTATGTVTGSAWSEPLPSGGAKVAMGSRAIQCSQ